MNPNRPWDVLRHCALTQINASVDRTSDFSRRGLDDEPEAPSARTDADEVHHALHDRTIVLIDVREPQEYVTERIHGALLFPLSSFDPRALPADGRPVVLHCGSGKRSAMAVAKCVEAGLPITRHMKGGIMAWKHARFPTITLDPGTGAVVDRQ